MRTFLAGAAAAVCLLAAPGHAHALSCAPATDAQRARAADVILDGVLLSGQRQQPLGLLVAPARLHVLRYLKGRGPRVVKIDTGVPLLVTGDDSGLQAGVPGEFAPYPGQAYRIYGNTPAGAGSSARLGLKIPHACGGTHEIASEPFLDRRKGAGLARRDVEGERWTADLLRGPHGLRCLELATPALGGEHLECARLRRRGQLVAAVAPWGKDVWSTGVAVAGPGLLSVQVDGPSGRVTIPAEGRNRVAFALLPAYAERADLTVTARVRGGATIALPGFGGGLVAADPGGTASAWAVDSMPPQAPTAGVRCAAYAQRFARADEVFSFTRPGECGRSRKGFFAVRYVQRYSEASGRPEPFRTIVFGVAPPNVQRVTVAGADGVERDATRARRGGAFAAVYPPDARHPDLTVTFHLRGGGRRSFAGQRDVNVVPPPRPRLG